MTEDQIVFFCIKAVICQEYPSRSSGRYTRSFSLETEWVKMSHWESGLWQANTHHFILWIDVKMVP